MMRRLVFLSVLLSLSFLLAGLNLQAQTKAGEENQKYFYLDSLSEHSLYVSPDEAPVVHTAKDLVVGDAMRNNHARLQSVHSWKNAHIVAGTITDRNIRKYLKKHPLDLSPIEGRHEAFLLKVVDSDHIVILGSDKRGTAYGLMELSRWMGVTPWVWWADADCSRHRSIVGFPVGRCVADCPTVPYRGIFINDEDWGMMPWASQNYEPRQRALHGGDPTPVPGEIGPYTHEKIFELLLRLRANAFWPAMHDCSKPFYLTPGNQEMADKYGILVSTSHCEPMMSNANGEWRAWANDPSGHRYNYVTNRDSVLLFWEKRVKELKNSDCIYTLGMRGIHDGPMQGAKSVKEQVAALTNILKDQRDLLAKHVNPDVEQIPQQFVPYKEVLDCWRSGLEVPEDVTLIWCDDNYGYVRHMPTEAERHRKGGNGIYYHISYWGRPHDYLWLSSIHPELMRSEMLRAYDHGIDRIWILNVGDIKPAEYETQLFLDMAWNPDRFREEEALDQYCDEWYDDNIPWWEEVSIAGFWREYYDLCFDFKPEFLGGDRTEEKDPSWKQIHDLPLNETQIRERIAHCKDGLKSVHQFKLHALNRDAFFQLVEYPVCSAIEMNLKYLYAQLARHGLGEWQPAHEAHDRIVALTEKYNTMLDGKWSGMMDMAPRKLVVFNPIEEKTVETPMPKGRTGEIIWQYKVPIGKEIPIGECLETKVQYSGKELPLELRFLPVHPTDEKQIRCEVSVDGGKPQVVEYHTEGRSEEWKQNVLTNSAVRQISLPIDDSESVHVITIRALDEAVRLQQVSLNL